MSEGELRQGPGARLRLYRHGPLWEGAACATIGDLACDGAGAGAALLRETCASLRAEGVARVIGPMAGSTWGAYRLVTHSDGSPAFLMEPQSGPDDRAAFAQAGFTEIAQYFSARVALADVPPAPAVPEGVTLHIWDGTDPEARFSEVHDLSCQSFAGNAFYTPLSRAAFLAQYMPFVPVLRPEFLIFARDAQGALLGYLFGLPNYAEGAQPGSVILKTYASRVPGVGGALAGRFHDTARSMGFSHAIHALIHADNRSAARSRLNRAQVFRRYALLGRRLDG
jgi:hypothetical protein